MKTQVTYALTGYTTTINGSTPMQSAVAYQNNTLGGCVVLDKSTSVEVRSANGNLLATFKD